MAEKILVIDDEKEICGELSIFLSEEGYQPFTALDGDRGLSIFKSQRPDLVLTDYRMPGKTGIDVLKEIRDRDNLVPVIMISGQADMKIAVEALKEKAFDFLEKPVNLKNLGQLIKDALKRRKLLMTDKEVNKSHFYNHKTAGPNDSISLVQLFGSLDEYSRNKIKQGFELLINGGNLNTKVVLLLNEVQYINNAGLELLLELFENHKGRYKLVFAELHTQVSEYMKILGYLDYFPTFPSRDEAIRHFA